MITYDCSARGELNLYEYLYQCLRDDILSGRLAVGEKLPSKRSLAEHLSVSVKTVENAYNQLLLEGYLQSRERSGYFVEETQGARPIERAGNRPRQAQAVHSGRDGQSTEVFHTRYREEKWLVDFAGNSADYGLFPFSTWAKLLRETLTEYDTALLWTVPWNGVMELRVAIAHYLYASRGMEVSPDNIIVGAGTEYLYGRLLQLLGPDAVYGVEDPGYKKLTQLYDANHARWEPIPIDEKGMRRDALEGSAVSVLHVSPEHHFPVGLVMPIGRRQELLSWAAEEKERYIIEDDYDCEFRMSGRPIPSLQSMDRHHRVIYINTFSKTMVPSLRIAYMVLPQRLMERYIATMNFYSGTVSGFEQYALAAFLERGYFERHLRRLKKAYCRKREEILHLFARSPLSAITRTYLDDAGTHFLLRVETALTDVEIKWAAKEHGIHVCCLSEFCFRDAEKYHGILVLHYSEARVEALAQAVHELEEIFLPPSERG